MILLDGAKIKRKLLATYKRRKKVLDGLSAELLQYQEKDYTLYQQFLAQRFGAEQTQEREIQTKICFIDNRIQLIHDLSIFRGLSAGQYCYELKKQVTPETDFWTLIDKELQQMEEEERKEEEEARRREEARIRKKRERVNKQGKKEKNEDIDYLDEDDDFQDIADQFINMLDDFCSHLGDKNSFEEFNDEEKHELKKLYRELCLRYHPDRIGQHDAKMKRLWDSIQDAYQSSDLESLRSIYLEAEMGTNRVNPTCSELINLIGDINDTICSVRVDVDSKKKVPFWGFSTWNETQINHALVEIADEYKRLINSATEELTKCEKKLEKMLNHIPAPKRTKRNRVASGWEQTDLFD